MRGRERKLKHWWYFLGSNFNAVYQRDVQAVAVELHALTKQFKHTFHARPCQLISKSWVIMGCWLLTSLAMGGSKAAAASRASTARLSWGRAPWPAESLRSAGPSLGSRCRLLAVKYFVSSFSNLGGMRLLALEMWKNGL